MLMRILRYTSCALVSLLLWANPPVVLADDDWEDYYEDLKDAREDHYDDLKDAREDYEDDLEDYYDDLEDHQKDQARRSSGGYAVEPYWSYPQEYYIFGGHPSRYYYTYPDRYYSQQYRYNATPRSRSYGSQSYQSDPNFWRYDVYGYNRPYRDRSGSYQQQYRSGGDIYRYKNDGYRYPDGGKYDRLKRR